MQPLSVSTIYASFGEVLNFLGYQTPRDFVIAALLAMVGIILASVQWRIVARRALLALISFIALVFAVTAVRTLVQDGDGSSDDSILLRIEAQTFKNISL